MSQTPLTAAAATRAATRLAFEATGELTRVVEGMHANIAAASLPWGEGTDGRTRGITGLVYQSIRRVSAAAGFGVDQTLGLLERAGVGRNHLPQAQLDAVLAVLNGVLGDRLAQRDDSLAIPMQLRRDGRALEPGDDLGGRKLLLMVHGLCMNDRQWLRNGHVHGEALAGELDASVVDLLYNSGRHVSQNGQQLAQLLERFVEKNPTPLDDLAIVAHSMGGLVVRSACHQAAQEGLAWPRRLRKIVFLGTPHHGAPLERAGSWVHTTAELSPYVAPLARLATLRSAGITDLRFGSILDADWRGGDRFERGPDTRQPCPLPVGVACYAAAGMLTADRENPAARLLGDGLVPLDSALGRHPDPTHVLPFPDSHRWIGAGLGHLDLLESPAVYETLRGWLSDAGAA